MAGTASALLFLYTCSLAYHSTYGGYLITTPREVTKGTSTQICVVITDNDNSGGSVNFVLTEDRREIAEQLLNKTIQVPAGKTEFCEDVALADSTYYTGVYNVTGSLGGKEIYHTGRVRLRSRTQERVFIQTDKNLYQAGQTVQIRILSITGPKMNVSTANYPEVWVETPARTRIAQWLDVDNSAGIVHLNMQLVDEPEEGSYRIRLKTGNGNSKIHSFRVGEYVLPRFEVKITPPSYILATDSGFNFTVCAKYTFGQPVKGNMTLKINNSKSRLCRVAITKMENITGCKTYEFTTEEMQVTDCSVYSLSVDVLFEEEGTGVQMEAYKHLSITRNAITFREIYADEYMKPNLPTTVKVKAEYPDKSPASGIPVEVCAAGKCNKMLTAEDGIFTAVLPAYKTNRIFMKATNCRADLHSASYSKQIDHFYSPSNSSLLIHAPEEELKCAPGEAVEHLLPVLFSATNQTSAFINVQVISRGQIQYWTSKEYNLIASDLPISMDHLVEPLPTPPKDTVRGVLNIPLTLPSTASPQAKVLIWYARDDGEVVSDTRELKVAKCLSNSASLSWSAEQAQPGDETTLTLSSKANSVCSIGVVDKSTQLLSQQSDTITVQNLFNFVNNFNINPWSYRQTDDDKYCREKHEKELKETLIGKPLRHYSYHSLYADSLKMFDDSGLYVFTDLTVETRPCEKEERIIFHELAFLPGAAPAFSKPNSQGGGGASFGAVADKVEISSDSESKEAQDSPRTDFPETWLWDIVVVPSTGVHNQQVTLPDTITEWVGNALCAHPEEGVGLSQEKSITTFLPFFIDLTLPPSIKRGEILPVKISVFNYLSQSLPVTVRLEESPEYEILEEPGLQGPIGQRTSCLAKQDKEVHTVRINALTLGDVNLTVSAFIDYENSQSCSSGNTSVTRRDTIIKPIKVEAEGYPREKTWTKYICSQDFESGDDSLEVWEVFPPSVIVEGSDRGWVSAVGDLLALSLENLGHLIRMPYGCGEQNMLNFAPNIFIMKYLQVTRQNTTESTNKLVKFMTTGYRRELLYRHSNGAFSAFGSADDSGSTWLTAFVLKSFAQAQPYILVDKASLKETRHWLENQQDKDGCFLSVGKIFHKGMKGGITGGNNSIPLTTYVMISLLEAGEDPSSPTIDLARQCLSKDTSQDPYTLALKAYAFALAKFPEAQKTLQQLIDLAVITKNATYWELPKGPSKSKAVELETAAYAILAMVELNFTQYEQQARKVVKWITGQRNGRGGFYSTQDTVMALQALASYETFLYQGPLHVEATVTATNLTHTFTVTDSNKLLQQLVTLPTFPTNVTLGMEGQGCAVLQAVLRYNIPEPEASDAFDLTVNTRTEVDRKCVTKRITACSSYRLPDEKSNMAVIEVNLVSGYIPKKDDLKDLVKMNKDIKRYEVDGNKVSFYIEELTSKSTCVNFDIIREIEVENVKPGTVVVYDYYQPEFSISESYTLPPPDECRR